MAKQTYLDDIQAGLDAAIADLEAHASPVMALPSVMAPTESPEWDDEAEAGVAARREAWPSRQSTLPLIPPESARSTGALGGEQAHDKPAGKSSHEQQPLPAVEAMFQLSNRLAYLSSLKHQLDADPEMLSFLDSIISDRVKAAERRQKRYATFVTMLTSVLSLVAGWLLSAVNPSVLAHVLVR